MPKSSNPYGTRPALNVEGRSVDVKIINKEDDSTVASQSFELGGVHESLRGHVALYGLSKLLQDRSSDTPTGPDKLAAMSDVFAQLAEGTWQKERKVGAPTVSAEVEALAEIKGCTVAEIQQALRAYSKETRQEILANPRVVERAVQIKEGRQDVDLSDLAA